MRKSLLLIDFLFIFMFVNAGFAANRILVVVENGFVHAGSQYSNAITQYMQDVKDFDYKTVILRGWPTPSGGTNVQLCTPLLQQIQQEYTNALVEGDSLEGVVLIGNLPVPQYITDNYYPLDQVFMDIVDAAGQPYAPPTYPNYTPYAISSGGFYTGFCSTGDFHYEIWVSRINPAYMDAGIRQGSQIISQNDVILNYLNRVHQRMVNGANVPSRGFAMGGPANHLARNITLDIVMGSAFRTLNLPWFAELTLGHNSSFNWMSQLLAGPRGCINYGAFYGGSFQGNGDRRYCRYNQLGTVYLPGNPNPVSQTVNQADSLGWEWAGLYNHSCPIHTNFFSWEEDDASLILNGQFVFGTYGPEWGGSYVRGGFNQHYRVYEDGDFNLNPYLYGFGWKGKSAQWQWPATATKDYYVYMYYELYPPNCTAVRGLVNQMTMNGGLPSAVVHQTPYIVNQQLHTAGSIGNWEQLKDANNNTIIVTLNQGEMGVITFSANDGLPGEHIADAVRFISTDGTVDVTVDDAERAGYTEVDNDPSVIFRTKGFYTSDQVTRAYEDMGDEPGGGGFSKPQFFLLDACGINDWTHIASGIIDKNPGNLYALGHNGLISMGASTTDWADANDKVTFAQAIQSGNNFGQAFLAQSNTHFLTHPDKYPWDPTDYPRAYALLGTGTLRAQPYIQYGSQIVENQTITTTQTLSTNKPVLIRNVTVNGSGKWTVTSTYNSSSSPFGTHSEIVIRPECDFAPTGSNTVNFRVN